MWQRNILYVLLNLCYLLFNGCSRDVTLKEWKELKDYPSGSGLEFYNNHIYLIGDDAAYLAVLNVSFNITDTINLISSAEKRIPKNIKPDLESATFTRNKFSRSLLLLGSGSLAPYRNTAWVINTVTKQKEQFALDTFFHRLLARGIEQVNIEGVAAAPGVMLLANRGNKSYPKNHLIFTAPDFWKNQANAFIKILPVGSNSDSAFFNGISGLAYSSKSDRLILTVSTENTYSTHGDGAIGKSYLWLIDDISAKRRFVAINPNKIIDLNALDKRFEGHKMESVCITGETNKKMELVLVADDDKGTSLLFSVTLKK